MTIEKDVTGYSYVQIPNALIDDPNLDAPVLGLLVLLLSKPFDWQLRTEQIAKDCGINVKTARKYIKKLTDLGYLKREKIKGGRIKTYIYNEPRKGV